MSIEQYMTDARMVAAQCWCDPETANREMDAALCEAVAKRIAGWMETAAQFCRNEEYYRGLLDQCAEHIGIDAYVSDDGSVQDSPVRAKIPELVERLYSRHERENS